MAQPANTSRATLAIFPNPLAENVATLRYSLPNSGELTLKLIDVTGRTVLTRTYVTGRSGTTSLDLRQLSAGVYLVKLVSNNLTVTQKLVVKH